MLYNTLVETYENIEATSKRLEMIDLLRDLFNAAAPDEIDKIIYLTQGKIHPDWTGRPEIGMAEKMVVESIVKVTGQREDGQFIYTFGGANSDEGSLYWQGAVPTATPPIPTDTPTPSATTGNNG